MQPLPPRIALFSFLFLLWGLGCMCGDFFGETIGDRVSNEVSDRVAEGVTESITEAAIEQSASAQGAQAEVDVGNSVDLDEVPAFARYPGATARANIAVTGNADQGEGSGGMFLLQTADSVDEVTAWYQESLESWHRKAFVETDQTVQLIFDRQRGKSKEGVQISISRDDPHTVIHVIHGSGPHAP